ncbi:1,4-dihydropyridine esterase [Streptomyces sp. NPDC003691]
MSLAIRSKRVTAVALASVLLSGVVAVTGAGTATASGTAGAAGAERPAGPGSGGEPRYAAGRSVTLATGERISADRDGKGLRYEQPEGRKHIPLMFRTGGGRTQAVPLDLADDLAAGRQDPRRFDITELTGRAPGAQPGSAEPGGAGGPDRASGAAASGDRARPRTPAATHTLTLDFIGRDGAVGRDFEVRLQGLTGAATGSFHMPDVSSGRVTLQVAPGRYVLEAVNSPSREGSAPVDMLIQPVLEVGQDTTLTVDARDARPARFSVPDAQAVNLFTMATYTVAVGEHVLGSAMPVTDGGEIRTAHLGPEVTDGSLSQSWQAMWERNTTDYKVIWGEADARRVATGPARRFTDAELATVHTGLGSSGTGAHGDVSARGEAPGSWFGLSPMRAHALPAARTLKLSTVPGTTWALQTDQDRYLPSGGLVREGSYFVAPRQYTAGSVRRETFNTGVFSPSLASGGVFRSGNTLMGALPVFADGRAHEGWSQLSSARTTLHRDGVLIGESGDPLTGGSGSQFTVPAGDASYTLATSVTRDAAVGRASSRVDAAWTFRSRETTAVERLPVSTVRFHTPVDLASTAPAGARQRAGVVVEGPASRPGNLASLDVLVSYDRGANWQPVTVTNGRFQIDNPAKDRSVSFRASFGDRDGNRGTVTVLDAYFTR